MPRPKRSPPVAAPPTFTPAEDVNAMFFKRSRHSPTPGDLFAVNMCGKRWVIGRVISNNAVGLTANANLLYFYRMEVEDPFDPTATKTPIAPDLLIPPEITNNLGWTRGFYLHLRNVPLQPQELLPRHVFKSEVYAENDPRRFIDEYGNPTPPPEPGLFCGMSGLSSYTFIDDALSIALGIPPKKD